VVALEPVSGLADTSGVTIDPATIASISVAPARISLPVGQTQQFDATATLSDGSTDANPSVTWSATGGSISTGGLYTAGSSAGSFRVIARSGNGKADTSAVTITTTAPTVTALAVTPASASLSTGQTLMFAATATLSDGSSANVSVTWTATGGSITSGGRYTAGSTAGGFRVIARSSNGIADTAAVTITAATITAVTVTPSSANLVTGQTQQFRASATLSNGSTQSNPSVTWSATGGTISTAGLYTAGTTTGSFQVVALAANGMADTSAVSIGVAPTITALSVTPATASVELGATQQFSVSATLSNGSTQANPSVTWTATGGTVSTGGSYTAGSTLGSFIVVATVANGVADTSAVTIIPVQPPPVGFPNRPSGMTVILDEPFNSKDRGSSWWYRQPEYTNRVQEATDATAPYSPSNMQRFFYPAGLAGGQGAGASGIDWSPVRTEYIAFYFRHSANWQYHSSGVNKMLYFGTNQTPGGETAYENFFLNDNGSVSIIQQNGIDRRMRSNVGSGTMALGRWHLLEAVVTASTGGQANGTVDWWVDGVQRGHYTDVVWQVSGDAIFNGLDLDPIWGGIGDTKSHDDTFDIDHLYVAGKN
jgi:hypothetical protein